MIITLKKQPDQPKLYTWEEIKKRQGIYQVNEAHGSVVATFVAREKYDKPFQLLIRSNHEVVLCSEPELGAGWDICKFKEIEAELTISNFVSNIK